MTDLAAENNLCQNTYHHSLQESVRDNSSREQHFIFSLFLLPMNRISLVFCFLEPEGYLRGNCILSVSESLGLVVGRRVEINTMRTRVTLNITGLHVLLSGGGVANFTHARVLPRILLSIQEVDVISCNVKTTIYSIGAIGFRLEFGSKNACAVVGPEVELKHF